MGRSTSKAGSQAKAAPPQSTEAAAGAEARPRAASRPRVVVPARTVTPGRKPAAPARSRLGPRERERMIVDGAVSFFAEVGFAGQTRELSRRLSITQPLLYRYFPSKKALIDRVYKEVFLGNWNAGWERDLEDRSKPLRDRLIAFYSDYVRVLFTPEWIRLYMYSGLAGIGFNRRYIARFERLILKRMALELRHDFGPAKRAAAIRPQELEVLWQLHGGIFYYGVRRYIYGARTNVDTAQMIEGAVDAILAVGKNCFERPEAAPRKSAKAGRA